MLVGRGLAFDHCGWTRKSWSWRTCQMATNSRGTPVATMKRLGRRDRHSLPQNDRAKKNTKISLAWPLGWLTSRGRLYSSKVTFTPKVGSPAVLPRKQPTSSKNRRDLRDQTTHRGAAGIGAHPALHIQAPPRAFRPTYPHRESSGSALRVIPEIPLVQKLQTLEMILSAALRPGCRCEEAMADAVQLVLS